MVFKEYVNLTFLTVKILVAIPLVTALFIPTLLAGSQLGLIFWELAQK